MVVIDYVSNFGAPSTLKNPRPALIFTSLTHKTALRVWYGPRNSFNQIFAASTNTFWIWTEGY